MQHTIVYDLPLPVCPYLYGGKEGKETSILGMSITTQCSRKDRAVEPSHRLIHQMGDLVIVQIGRGFRSANQLV